MTRVTFFFLDLVLCLIVASAVAIVLTGGTTLSFAGQTLRAHSIGNLLMLGYLLGAVRYAALGSVPFLLHRRFGRLRLEDDSRRMVTYVRTKLTALTPAEGVRIVAGLMCMTLAIKLTIAAVHMGFFSGDDVEIHEMTLARIFRQDWQVWNLRSAFYPMTFIYPVQALLAQVGMTDVSVLVVAGRAVVAGLSTIALVPLYVAVRRDTGVPTAILSALLLASSGLWVTFGATELPRPVTSLLILGAYTSLQVRRGSLTLCAGVLTGMAAAMRFSEIVFLAPATAHLLMERRWRDLWIYGASALLCAAGIQGLADYLYWGRPFSSALAMFDFTVVRGLSSRGYESPLYYLTALTSWTDVFVAGLALYGTTRRTWRPAVWALGPLVILSLLPHKEPRYLLPMLPFFVMLAGAGMWRILNQLADGTLRIAKAAPAAAAPVFIAALAGSALFQLNTFHVRRSDDAVALARELQAVGSVDVIAAEQAWRMGGRLYLSANRIVDLDPALVRNSDLLARTARASNAVLIAITTESCKAVDCRTVLGSAGFEVLLERPDSYVVFKKHPADAN